jgi:hypothetical protein
MMNPVLLVQDAFEVCANRQHVSKNKRTSGINVLRKENHTFNARDEKSKECKCKLDHFEVVFILAENARQSQLQ